MQKPLFVVLGVLIVITILFYWYMYSGGKTLAPAETLSKQAIEGPSKEIQFKAALDLAASGREAVPQMRHVLKTSKDPRVRAAVIGGLQTQMDFESMPQLLNALDDPSPRVRGRAGAAVTRILGKDFFYRATGSVADRQKAIKAMRADYEAMKKNPPPEYRKR